jgi:hypothetical protein
VVQVHHWHSPISCQAVKTRFSKSSERTVQSDGWCCPSAQKGTEMPCGFCLSIKGQQIGEKWIIEAYIESNFAGDKDERKSITGYIISVMSLLLKGVELKSQNVAINS